MLKKIGKDCMEEDPSKGNVKFTFHRVMQDTGVGQVSEPGDDTGLLSNRKKYSGPCSCERKHWEECTSIATTMVIADSDSTSNFRKEEKSHFHGNSTIHLECSV